MVRRRYCIIRPATVCFWSFASNRILRGGKGGSDSAGMQKPMHDQVWMATAYGGLDGRQPALSCWLYRHDVWYTSTRSLTVPGACSARVPGERSRLSGDAYTALRSCLTPSAKVPDRDILALDRPRRTGRRTIGEWKNG